ncbi:adenylosuccinate lyase [Candidatus Palauibacter sp.]|uniref:adenylosuccinate lyase n=1 Tax=Candidatus Palauibacter sp. TaxID=3101350 RepID=UPI003B02CCD1
MAERHYPHPLIDRYASSEMAAIFSPRMQALVWRDLWIALAEEERALGVEIPNDAIVAMHAAREQIDLDRIAVIERDLRHDVMAHVHHFGEVAPEARKYIHLGATSAFVGDNHGLIQHRQGLDIVRDRLLGTIEDLAAFAREQAAEPTLGYTHLQPAQPTTIGKRACLWLQDLLFDLEQIEAVRAELRFRGARGTTGTEATFLELFDGDGGKVDRLNERLAARFGFAGTYDVIGQTYPRKVDHRALAALAGIGASTARFGHDIRILQAFGEIEEPFGKHQIGSSAMPYKRNPMRSERICALARHLCTLELDASWTASVQWFERTLDDSANRRISLPEGYLSADAILILARNVSAGLVVHPAVVARRLGRALPFMVTEEILIAGVRGGGDRQDLHERVRGHALAARERLDDGAEDNDFFTRIAADGAFGLGMEDLGALADPHRLVGRSARQVERFLTARIDPLFADADAPRPAEEVRV